jgi:hypothetical protein
VEVSVPTDKELGAGSKGEVVNTAIILRELQDVALCSADDGSAPLS